MKDDVPLVETSKVSKENVIPKLEVHSTELPSNGDITSSKRPNHHNVNNPRIAEQPHQVESKSSSGMNELSRKTAFQSSSIDFHVKSLDEIRKGKGLKKSISSNDTVTPMEKVKNSSSAMIPVVTQDSSSVRPLEDILMEKRAKRFGLLPNTEEPKKLLVTTTKAMTLDLSAKATSPGKLCAASPSTCSDHDKSLSSIPQTPSLASQKIVNISPAMNSGPPVTLSSKIPVFEVTHPTVTETLPPAKRPKMSESSAGSIAPPCPHHMRRISSTHLLDDFEELEKDLDLAVPKLPVIYNEDDLDQQLAEMENMFA
jgi:hypothetical protein